MNNSVSVIIPNYNYGRFLREAVDSVLAQTVKPKEIVVVDDGSTDDSAEILESYGDRIIVIRQQNQGVGAARNKGAEAATGEFLAFLDADDYWAPTKLEKQLAVFEREPEVGLVHCGFQNVDAQGGYIDENVIGDEGFVRDNIIRMTHKVYANAILLRRTIFEHLNGFDTNKDLHPAEDWDLIYRVSRSCAVGFVPEPLLFYRQHGRGGHTNIARMERAMLMGFGKAFAADSELHSIAHECYSKLFLVLAGSYFQAGQYGGFLRNAAKCIWRRPANLRYFLEFPIRRIRSL